jgi:hypothetical protein
MQRILMVLAVAMVVAAMVVASTGAALAVGGPNAAGNSGHFKHNSPPCAAPSDNPNCPGPA